MKRIYLDNGATSFPKAPGMAEAVYEYLKSGCVNLYRSESCKSFEVFDSIYTLRENLCTLFNFNYPEAIGFTRNVTESLNWIIKGLLTPSDHVIVSSNEHNAVMRPLVQMNIPFSRIPSDSHGFNNYENLEDLIRPNTKAIIINAAGNVSGAIQDLIPPSLIAKKYNLMFFVDAAQASPFVDIDMENLNLSGVAITGHKGFLGPQGIGAMLLDKKIAQTIPPLISGGTGTESDKETLPTTLPERLTPGTENIPALIGLKASLDYILKNKEELKQKVMHSTHLLMEGLSDIPGISLVGASIDECRTSVISITSDKKDIALIASELLARAGIETRVGLHCSPSSHKVLGTFPTGTLRFTPGPFTEDWEIEKTIRTLKEIIND